MAAPTKTGKAFSRAVSGPLASLDDLGRQVSFYSRAFAWTFRVLRRYRTEVLRLLAEVSLGTGGLAVIGGSVVIVAFMTFFTGSQVGLQGFNSLDQIGTSALTGFVASYFNTREIAPLVSALALSATVGCGFTAQLGAMRISDEIDALEVMGIPSMPYLVTTRMIAGMIAVVPLYVVGLLASYGATRFVVTATYGQSTGTYDHYFNLFLPPQDILWSFLKIIIFAVLVMLIHCYFGFTASGGPAGVGTAVGRAVRTSIVVVSVVDLLLGMAIWGTSTDVRIAG
ncbi:putative phospholipid ABC transporter permease protein MlaE [Actinomadura rubteroloni]|uniref:Putative phospholipid ABC transporter permease protein MlaE n=1 Tax=Actinomadura rubteroloni TaxID=1926885 RepID=A0A2P4UK66_9ACTN|nr:ABC transporter permease [Actinomadura rubteroloni]POM25418.1 putative phospholipid ABC transporter permease protein MlaE [Actinomadura rubteroloni]